jgi:catechol 2,3-dioxygenase-like lactoylglutathione lyase family enzyme
MIHHVQLACPPGSEARLRDFYCGVLGLQEVTMAGAGRLLVPRPRHRTAPGRGARLPPGLGGKLTYRYGVRVAGEATQADGYGGPGTAGNRSRSHSA